MAHTAAIVAEKFYSLGYFTMEKTPLDILKEYNCRRKLKHRKGPLAFLEFLNEKQRQQRGFNKCR